MPGARPSKQSRAQGRPGARCTHGPRARRCLRVRALTTGTGGNTPAFPAQWFTAYFAISPVNQLIATVTFARRMPPRRLGACMGAPGPRDLTVREARRSSVGLLASTASRPASVTTRPPLVPRRDGPTIHLILSSGKQNYFDGESLTEHLRRDPSGKSPLEPCDVSRAARLSESDTSGHRWIVARATPRPPRRTARQGCPPTATRHNVARYAQLFSEFAKGNMRMRLPVALNIAFATAGPIGGTPGSPTPVGGADDVTM